jgi:alpha-1,2-mannosyltransferase
MLLGICLWLVYALDLATPGLIDRAGHLKGADFLHPYVLGSLVNEHRPEALYDAGAQVEQGVRLVPQSEGVWFVPVYPPQYALFFAPLARMPYVWAFAFWSLLTAAVYGAGCYVLWKSCPNLYHQHDAGSGGFPASTLVILALAFPGFVTLIMFGQNSVLAFAAFTLMHFALRSRRSFLAGVALGLLAYKPQLALVAAAVFLFTLEWKVILGALVSVAAQFGVVVTYFGPGVLRDYWNAITHLSQYAALLEPKPYLMFSLRAFWGILLPWPTIATALYLVTATIVLFVAVMSWRRLGPTRLGFAVLLLATVLVAPHLTLYDLIITAPTLLFAGDWVAANREHQFARRLGLLIYFSYWTALLGPFTRFTHFQIAVPVFAALLLTLAAMSREATGSRFAAGATANCL